MGNLSFILLGFLLVLDNQYKQYILNHIRPEYFGDECLKEIFLALKTLIVEERVIDILSLRDKIITDEDAKTLDKRLKEFKKYLIKQGKISDDCSDTELQNTITSLLAEISCSVDYSIPVDKVVQTFIHEYVTRAKQSLLAKYQLKLKSNPAGDYTAEIFENMKGLDALLSSESWKEYVVDINALAKEDEEPAILFRKDMGVFWRQNIYLISGNPGAMKSLFCLCLASAACNNGVGADRTLFFHGLSAPLKVLYADTQMMHNTLQKRAQYLLKMLNNRYDQDHFNYLWLKKVLGGVDAKLRVLTEACRSFRPDLIVIDSARDLCVDYNDNREADSLVAYLTELAMELNAAIVSTSHISINNGNAKGHFGVRMTEMADTGFVLEKQKEDGRESIVNVTFPKERENENSNFSFRMSLESGLLEECTPTVDYTDERRQFRNAEERVRAVLRCGEVVRYKELIGRIKGPVSERTAKDYISCLVGKVLVKSSDGYSLSDSEVELPLEKEDDEDMPPA